jgi:hypothetical protein
MKRQMSVVEIGIPPRTFSNVILSWDCPPIIIFCPIETLDQSTRNPTLWFIVSWVLDFTFVECGIWHILDYAQLSYDSELRFDEMKNLWSSKFSKSDLLSRANSIGHFRY